EDSAGRQRLHPAGRVAPAGFRHFTSQRVPSLAAAHKSWPKSRSAPERGRVRQPLIPVAFPFSRQETSMLLPQFDPPAFLDDFSPAQKLTWSSIVSNRIDLELSRNPGHHFYNPKTTDTTPDVVVTDPPIFWTAFPRQVQVAAPSDEARWRQADS